jgi:hypothetical protein
MSTPANHSERKLGESDVDLHLQTPVITVTLTPPLVLLLVSSLSLMVDGAANSQSGSSPTAEEPSAEEIKRLSDKYHAECMRNWDADTHMTKQNEPTPADVSQGRLNFRLESGMGLPAF